MSLLYDSCEQFFDTLFNYNRLLIYIKKEHKIAVQGCQTLNHINGFFLEKINLFPKYDYPLNFVENLFQFDQMKIKNSNTSNIEDIQYLIQNELVLSIKKKISDIPDLMINMITDKSYQTSTQNNLYDFLNSQTYIYETKYRNFFNYILFSNKETTNANINSFLLYYYLYTILNKLIPIDSRFQIDLNKITIQNHEINYPLLIESFNSFINNNHNRYELSRDINNIVLRSVYEFTSISDKFNNYMIAFIDNNCINDIIESFQLFINETQHEISFYYNKNISLLIHNLITYQMLNKLYEQRITYIKSYLSLNNLITYYENEVIRKYVQKINEINIEEYMYCLQYHKTNSHKFINAIPLIISQYINHEIKSEGDDGLNVLDFKEILRSKEPYNYQLIDYKYIFQNENKYIKCMSQDAFDAVEVNDKIFASYDNVIYAIEVDFKTEIDNVYYLVLKSNYRGKDTMEVPRKRFGTSIYKVVNSSSIDWNISHEYFVDYLNSEITNMYICELIDTNNIILLAAINSLFPIINDFIDSDYFDKFIDKILFKIYKELRENGHTKYDHNWTIHKKLIKIYINSYLKLNIIEEKLFDNINIIYETIIHDEMRILPPLFKSKLETIERIRSNIADVNYRPMHRFYENMIVSGLSANLVKQTIDYFKF